MAQWNTRYRDKRGRYAKFDGRKNLTKEIYYQGSKIASKTGKGKSLAAGQSQIIRFDFQGKRMPNDSELKHATGEVHKDGVKIFSLRKNDTLSNFQRIDIEALIAGEGIEFDDPIEFIQEELYPEAYTGEEE